MIETYRLPRWLPTYLLFVLAAVLAVIACSGCKSMERAAKSTGGGSVVAVIFLFTPFPWAAIPVAALSGHIGSELQHGDDLKEEVKDEVQRQIKIVYRDVPYVPSFMRWGLIALAVGLAWRFRAGLGAFLRMCATLGVKAALLTLWGLVWGGGASAKAKAAVAAHEEAVPLARRLRLRPPAKIVSSEVKDHA